MYCVGNVEIRKIRKTLVYTEAPEPWGHVATGAAAPAALSMSQPRTHGLILSPLGTRLISSLSMSMGARGNSRRHPEFISSTKSGKQIKNMHLKNLVLPTDA